MKSERNQNLVEKIKRENSLKKITFQQLKSKLSRDGWNKCPYGIVEFDEHLISLSLSLSLMARKEEGISGINEEITLVLRPPYKSVGTAVLLLESLKNPFDGRTGSHLVPIDRPTAGAIIFMSSTPAATFFSLPLYTNVSTQWPFLYGPPPHRFA